MKLSTGRILMGAIAIAGVIGTGELIKKGMHKKEKTNPKIEKNILERIPKKDTLEIKDYIKPIIENDTLIQEYPINNKAILAYNKSLKYAGNKICKLKK